MIIYVGNEELFTVQETPKVMVLKKQRRG